METKEYWVDYTEYRKNIRKSLVDMGAEPVKSFSSQGIASVEIYGIRNAFLIYNGKSRLTLASGSKVAVQRIGSKLEKMTGIAEWPAGRAID